MYPLFAEPDTMPVGWLAVIIPLTTALSVFGGYVFNWWLKKKELTALQSERDRKAKIEDEDRAIEHYERFNARLESEVERLNNEIDKLRLTELRAISWIRHLEDRMRAAAMPFDPWDEIVVRNPIMPKVIKANRDSDDNSKAE